MDGSDSPAGTGSQAASGAGTRPLPRRSILGSSPPWPPSPSACLSRSMDRAAVGVPSHPDSEAATCLRKGACFPALLSHWFGAKSWRFYMWPRVLHSHGEVGSTPPESGRAWPVSTRPVQTSGACGPEAGGRPPMLGPCPAVRRPGVQEVTVGLVPEPRRPARGRRLWGTLGPPDTVEWGRATRCAPEV